MNIARHKGQTNCAWHRLKGFLRVEKAQPVRRSQARDLRILNAVAEALNSASDIQQALSLALSLVADLLRLESGWVWLLDPDTNEFFHAAAQNLPPYLQEPERMNGHVCWCIDDFRAGRLSPRNINVMKCSRLRSALPDQAEATCGLRYHASIPFAFQGRPLGIMNVSGTDGRRLTRAELRLLETIAYQVGVAVERARLAENSERLARAEERARIARDIHDTLAQGLTAIGLHIESALPHLLTQPEQARTRLLNALDATRQSLEDARGSVLNLRAGLPDGKPLASALGALARAFTSETGIPVTLRIAGQNDVPAPIENELFRIAQESLTNVRRHARASTIAITLRTDSRTVRLALQDNGQGCDAPAIRKGQGMRGMEERAGLLGGRCRCFSRAGKGTTVAVIIPLSQGSLP